MKTLSQVLRMSRRLLEEHQVERARQTAEEIIAAVLRMSRTQLYLYFDRPVDHKEWRRCHTLLLRKIEGEPYEYLFRRIEFYRCQLKITPSALIPRQETEILLHKACALLKGRDLQGKKAWDICCGSGCLGLGLKRAFPELDVTLSDLSDECVTLSKTNAQLNHLDVHVCRGDLLEPFFGKAADIVFCNPPYISHKEYESLDRSVRDYEPEMALVGGESGLEFYQRLASELPAYLNDDSWLFLEIGASQGPDVLNIFSAPCWTERALHKDWAGHDRFVFINYNGS